MASWSDNIRKVEPYVPGEQPKDENVIKLNTNENPYGPSPRIRDIEQNAEMLRLYPDPAASMLVDAIAEYHGVATNQVFVGVGSDDVLAMSFLTFFNSDKPVLFPDITYSFYKVWAGLFRIPYETVPLKDDFRIDFDDYTRQNGGIVIANPNAPTSIYEPVEALEKVVKANPASVVIIDEAYIDFAGESALSLVDKYDNVLVVRTFSKSRSMAGLRIGYAVGNVELINALKSVKLSYNSYTMNMPSIILGTEAVKDEEYFRSTINKVVSTRNETKAALEKLGFAMPASGTNFLFASHKTVPAKYIFEELRAQGIYVRYFNSPRIDNYLRITIGTDEEMAEFMEKLEGIIAQYSRTV